MQFGGKIFKDGNWWLIEVPSLDLMTQGKTKQEALNMIVDAVVGLAESYFILEERVDITAIEYEKGIIGLSASNAKILLALSLRRQREKSGVTVRQAAHRIGSKYPNAYAQYEKGSTRMSFEKYDQLLRALDPERRSLFTVI